jgi:phage/plasmid-associated DNA primase
MQNIRRITVKRKREIQVVLFNGHKWYPTNLDSDVEAKELCQQMARKQHHDLVVHCSRNNDKKHIYSSFLNQSVFFRNYSHQERSERLNQQYKFSEIIFANCFMNCHCVLSIPKTYTAEKTRNVMIAFEKILTICVKTVLKLDIDIRKLNIRELVNSSNDPMITNFVAIYPIKFSNYSEHIKFWKFVKYHIHTLFLNNERNYRDCLMYLHSHQGKISREDIIQFDYVCDEFPIDITRRSLTITSCKNSIKARPVIDMTPSDETYLISHELNKSRFILITRSLVDIELDDSVSLDSQINQNHINVTGCQCKFTGDCHYDDPSAYQYVKISYDGYMQYKCTAATCKDRNKVLGGGLFNKKSNDQFPPITLETIDTQAERWYNEVIMGINAKYSTFTQLSSEIGNRDDGLAEVFSDIYKDRIRMTVCGNNVYLWNGSIWKKDECHLFPKLITKSLRWILWKVHHFHNIELQPLPPKDPLAKKLREKTNTCLALIDQLNKGVTNNIVKSLCEKFYAPHFDAEINQHPYKIISKSGMVDLKSGHIVDPLPGDNLTIDSPYEYHPCSCPLGKCGLEGYICDSKCNLAIMIDTFFVMMRNDPELYNHLRWSLGYCLSGDPKKKLAFVGYGNKYNGKSLVSNYIIDVMPMYAKAMDKSVVIKAKMSKQAGSASPEYVHLQGIRMAILNETGENDAIDEEQIKCVTGRDKKNVRGLYKDSFDMDMEFAPFICTNFKPKISITDPAVWERLAPVKFPVSFLRDPEEGNASHRKSDEDLARKFKMEVNKERMYNWLVRCCLYYVQNQDKPFPREIKDEIQRYKEECNMVVEFIEENKDCYTVEVNAHTDLKTFMKSLQIWCANRCMNKPNPKKVIEMLRHIDCEVKSTDNQITGLKSIQSYAIENGAGDGVL